MQSQQVHLQVQSATNNRECGNGYSNIFCGGNLGKFLITQGKRLRIIHVRGE